MTTYYVRIKPQLNGTNAVHKEDCPFLPDIENMIYLGEFSSSSEALREARAYFSEASGCYFCARECSHVNYKIIDYCLQKHGELIRFDLPDCN